MTNFKGHILYDFLINITIILSAYNVSKFINVYISIDIN